MVAEKKGRRAGDLGGNGQRCDIAGYPQYSTDTTAGSTLRAGRILDAWTETTFIEACRMRRIIEKSGKRLPKHLDDALRYMETDFADDWPMQIALFMGWRSDGVTWLVTDPEDLEAHNINEFFRNLDVFARILEASGRISAREVAV